MSSAANFAGRSNGSSAAPERNGNGRFGGSNCGGGPNASAQHIAALRQALVESVTEEDVREITRVLVAQARLGDFKSARLVLGYLLGKPAPAPAPRPDEVKPDAGPRPVGAEKAAPVSGVRMPATLALSELENISQEQLHAILSQPASEAGKCRKQPDAASHG